MYADAVRCTHNGTGGSGTITLAAVTGYPQPTDVFGTSGTKFVEYEICEYTDSTFATLSKYEAGYGSLNLATNVLTRTAILKTWNGTTYDAKSPTALTFGNTAANIQILLTATTANTRSGLMSTLSLTGANSDIWQPFNTRVTYDSGASTFTMTSGSRLYIPIEYIYTRPISQVAVEVTTGVASGAVRMGLYDVDPSTGGPANLITEFTSSVQIDASATGFRSVTMGTPFWTPPGMYWKCIQANSSTIALRRLTHNGHSLLSTNGSSRDILMADKGATYGALPATADTSFSTPYNRSGGGQVAGFYK